MNSSWVSGAEVLCWGWSRGWPRRRPPAGKSLAHETLEFIYASWQQLSTKTANNWKGKIKKQLLSSAHTPHNTSSGKKKSGYVFWLQIFIPILGKRTSLRGVKKDLPGESLPRSCLFMNFFQWKTSVHPYIFIVFIVALVVYGFDFWGTWVQVCTWLVTIDMTLG